VSVIQRAPWYWPLIWQRVTWVATALVVLLLSPWCWDSWQEWEEAQRAHSQVLTQQQATQALLAQSAQWVTQQQAQASVKWVDVNAWIQMARAHGIQLAQVGLDAPIDVDKIDLQKQPTRMHVQGSWDAWLQWLSQWPEQAPGVTLSSLLLKADARGGIAAQLLAEVPQAKESSSSFDLASVESSASAQADPFNAQAWSQSQREHAQQHPSFAKLVAPELQRAREPLEAWPLTRLQYVGQIASGSAQEALVKVLPESGVSKKGAFVSVHRVRVGSYMGQNFGRVVLIHDTELKLQELVLTANGEWRIHEASLPLQEEVP